MLMKEYDGCELEARVQSITILLNLYFEIREKICIL